MVHATGGSPSAARSALRPAFAYRRQRGADPIHFGILPDNGTSQSQGALRSLMDSARLAGRGLRHGDVDLRTVDGASVWSATVAFWIVSHRARFWVSANS